MLRAKTIKAYAPWQPLGVKGEVIVDGMFGSEKLRSADGRINRRERQ